MTYREWQDPIEAARDRWDAHFDWSNDVSGRGDIYRDLDALFYVMEHLLIALELHCNVSRSDQ